jgi:4'-phosphopantetheinyl transferase
VPRAVERPATDPAHSFVVQPTMTGQAGGIELWLIDLDRCGEALELAERAQPRLSADDRERARALSDPHERRRRLAAYTALRVLIERVAGPAARGEPFVRGAGSKPRLDSGSAEFNLSHTEGYALVAVSRVIGPFGVDLEKLRPAKMAPRRLAEIVAVGEGLGDKPLSGLGAERAFLQAWARLEAFAKARGSGLAQTLVDLGLRGRGGQAQPLTLPQVRPAARRLADAAGLFVRDVRLLPGFQGAVAAPRGAHVPRVAMFPAQREGIDRLLVRPV